MTVSKIDIDAIYSFKAACKAVGLGETMMRKAIKEQKLLAKKAGTVIKIKGMDLEKWFNALPSASDNTPSSKADDDTDGKPVGGRTVEERALTSALR